MKRLILLCFCLFTGASLFGQLTQDVFPKNPIRAPRFHTITDKYFFLDNQVFWVTNFTNNEIAFNRLNSDFSSNDFNIIKLDSKYADYEIGTFQLNQYFYSFTVKSNQTENIVFAKRINATLTDYEDEKEILKARGELVKDVGKSTGRGVTILYGIEKKGSHFYVKTSLDNNSILIAYRMKSNEDESNYIYNVHLFDNELNEKWSTNLKFPPKKGSMSEPDFFISGNKIVATYLEKSHDSKNKFNRYGYLIIENGSFSDYGEEIGIGMGFIKNEKVNKFIYNRYVNSSFDYANFHQIEDGSIAFAALNSSSPSKKMFQSFVFNVIDIEKQTVHVDVFHKFDRSLFEEFETKNFEDPIQEKNKLINNGHEDGIYGLIIDKILPRQDGGFYLVFRQFHQQKKPMSDYDHANERSTLVVSIDTNQNVVFVHKIPKVVKMYEGRGTASFVYQDKLVSFFWDNLLNEKTVTNSNEPQYLTPLKTFNFVCVVIEPNGKTEKRVIHQFNKKYDYVPNTNSMQELKPGLFVVETLARAELQTHIVALRPVLIDLSVLLK